MIRFCMRNSMVSASTLEATSSTPTTSPQQANDIASVIALLEAAGNKKASAHTANANCRVRAGVYRLIRSPATANAMNVPAGKANSTNPNNPSDRPKFVFTSAIRGNQLPKTSAWIKNTPNIALCELNRPRTWGAVFLIEAYLDLRFLVGIVITLSPPRISSSFKYWRNSSATS